MARRDRMMDYLQRKGRLTEVSPSEDSWDSMDAHSNSPMAPEEGDEGSSAGGSESYFEKNLAPTDGYKFPPQALAHGGMVGACENCGHVTGNDHEPESMQEMVAQGGYPRSKEIHSMGAQDRIDELVPHMAHGGSMGKLGSGARFAHLTHELAGKGAHDPKALAAYIGRKKLGAGKMASLAAKGRARHAHLGSALAKKKG